MIKGRGGFTKEIKISPEEAEKLKSDLFEWDGEFYPKSAFEAKNLENKTIIKAIDMFGRVPEQWELLEEIERLNNVIDKKEQFLGDNIKRLEKEVVKRDNIINELEDSIVGKINVLYQVKGQSNAIQELSILLRQLQKSQIIITKKSKRRIKNEY